MTPSDSFLRSAAPLTQRQRLIAATQVIVDPDTDTIYITKSRRSNGRVPQRIMVHRVPTLNPDALNEAKKTLPDGPEKGQPYVIVHPSDSPDDRPNLRFHRAEPYSSTTASDVPTGVIGVEEKTARTRFTWLVTFESEGRRVSREFNPDGKNVSLHIDGNSVPLAPASSRQQQGAPTEPASRNLLELS